jgi:hypothetical protein
MRRLSGLVAAGLVVYASTTGAGGQAGRAAQACDHVCLTSIADSYLAALVAHDPAKAPMAPNAKFTEQAQVLAVGEGLWKTASEGPTTFKIPVPDPVAGQIGLIVMMKEKTRESGERAVQLALRLKVQNRQITEAEHVMARITNAQSLANLQTPRPALLATVPPAERSPRNLMLLIANSYYDSIVQSDGDAAPYADDCGRRENGMHTAGVGAPPPVPGAAPRGGGPPGGFRLQGCREQMNSRGLSYITSIDLRRVWIADEERGLVFGLTMFRQPMEEKFVTILNRDGTTSQRPMNFDPFDLEAAHIFKIQGGKIHEIEAMGFQLPLKSKNGWSNFTR